MAVTFEPITLVLKVFGCTNSGSINYNPEAEIDDNSCIDAGFTACIQNAVLSSSLKDCDLNEAKQNLEIYTYYQSLEAAIKEKNQHKIDMYKKKLAELCNAEYCETC